MGKQAISSAHAAPADRQSANKRIIEFIFYGNYFYGLCVAALILETAAQLKLSFDGPFIYIMAFLGTVLFYNYPYARNYTSPSNNPRTAWHIRHHSFLVKNQVVLTIALLAGGIWLVIKYQQQLLDLDADRWTLILIFPFAGALYYGSNFLSRKYNLRQVGWLKPFVIGFVWAGMTNLYPVLYADLVHSGHTVPTVFNVMLFLKAIMYVAMLAIMFDIKDYVIDSRAELNTLIVKFGLRKTILFVIIPLTILGLLTFISYAIIQHFSLLRMLLVMVPFVLLIASTRLFRKRRSLLFYLIVIDGLLLVKAIFGIAASFF